MIYGHQISVLIPSLLVLCFLLWLCKSLFLGPSSCFKQRARVRRQQQERAAVFARIRLEEQQRRQQQEQSTTSNYDPTAKALRLERILESLQFESPARLDKTTTNHSGSSSLEGDDPPYDSVMKRLFSSKEKTKTTDRVLADWSCGICLESYQEGQALCCSNKDKTECKHVFHEVCALEWLQEHSDCPLCRVRLIEVVEGHQNEETISLPPGQ